MFWEMTSRVKGFDGLLSSSGCSWNIHTQHREKGRRKRIIFPIPWGGRRISVSAFLSRRPFGYYLPIASYGTMFAAKWSSNGGFEAVISK